MLRRLWRGWRGESAKDPDADFLRARHHFESRQYDLVVAVLESVTARNPVHAEALNMLGLVLAREFGRFAEGAVLVRRAVEVMPAFREAQANLGWMLTELGNVDEGIVCLDRLLEVDPDDHEARLMRSTALLKAGRFAEGWPDYESRNQSVTALASPYEFPVWNGESNASVTLLVTAEQGIGDQIMFSSCLRDARPRVGSLLIECHPYLVPLLQRAFPRDRVGVRDRDGKLPEWAGGADVDAQLPMGSLPGLFRNDINSFPRHTGYLRANPDRVKFWEGRLQSLGPGLKAGLSWKGGTVISRRSLRSLAPEMLSPLLSKPGFFINLQYGSTEAELAEFAGLGGAGKFVHWPYALESYEETAALIVALDLVISVCTAVIHLAGALGRPVWILTPSAPEWRYLGAGETLPWYPSARLFRQEEPFLWTEVLERVAVELDAL
jgi:tetratricopeptide (TPR) repeat protein